MKQIGRLLVAGVALGAGHELGRILFMTGARVLDKKFRQDVRAQYNRRMHLVRDETPTGA